MLTDEVRQLVRETVSHAQRWNDDADHTVAGGLLTKSGRVVLGLNTHHFLGGPPAVGLRPYRITPRRPLTIQSSRSPLSTAPPGTSLLPVGSAVRSSSTFPPATRFVVREVNGLTTRTAQELLPFAHNWRNAERPQRIYMWQGYESAIRSGAKRHTIRIDGPFRLGPADLVFEKDNGAVVSIATTVTDVRSTTRSELTDDDAQRDGFDTLGELNAALETHYPGRQASSPIEIVAFELSGR